MANFYIHTRARKVHFNINRALGYRMSHSLFFFFLDNTLWIILSENVNLICLPGALTELQFTSPLLVAV